jgi:hypothetical protein
MRSAVTAEHAGKEVRARSVALSIGTKLVLATVLVLGLVSLVLFVELADR